MRRLERERFGLGEQLDESMKALVGRRTSQVTAAGMPLQDSACTGKAAHPWLAKAETASKVPWKHHLLRYGQKVAQMEHRTASAVESDATDAVTES